MRVYPQSPIERLLYLALLLLFIINIGSIFLSYKTLRTLERDDTKKFLVLKSNQDTLLCITKGFISPANFTDGSFIDNCVNNNKVKE